MADSASKNWQSIVKSLSAELPGKWTVARPGAKAILVRSPTEWTLSWVGLDRPRQTTEPYLLAGVAELISPFSLTYDHGLRSGDDGGPKKVDLLHESAQAQVRDFVLDHAVGVFDRWTPEALAAEAEEQFAVPSGERGRPMLYPLAAGWRVVLGHASPEEPANQAAAEFGANYAPKEAAWYRDLAGAWQSGDRPAALKFLEDHRREVLGSLKLA